MSIASVMPSSHLILLMPSSLLLLHSTFPSTRVFPNESTVHIRWPKHWSFSYSKILSKEYSGLISFKIDWLDLPTFQGTRKSSPAPQLESVSSVLFLLYCPVLKSKHEYQKDHNLDYTDLCWQSDGFAF